MLHALTQRLRSAYDAVAEASGRRPDGSLKRRVFYPIYALRVLVTTVRQWMRDRCPQMAASLAYQTALSMVPLIAVALAVLRATNAFAAESTLVDFLSKQVIPVSREEIAKHLLDMAGNITLRRAGIAGIATTLTLAFVMFSSVERIFNDIWRVERRRSFGQRFMVFYAMVTIVPTAVGVSLYQAARYGLTSGVLGWLAAAASTFAGLFFANKLLPATRVKLVPAVVGALLSTVLFEAAKHLFALYVERVAFAKYAGIYGKLGLVPILLVWIYFTWLVVLLGAEIAHSAQNLAHLERLDRRGHMSVERELTERVNGTVAARLLHAVYEAWRGGQKGVLREVLATRFELSDEVVDRIVRRLKDNDLLLEVDGDAEGLIPGKPATEVTIGSVLALFRGTDVVLPARASVRSKLDAALDRITEESRAANGVTFDHLLGPTAEPGRPAIVS